ncbi:hypothetical protein [Mycobacterium sp. Marseille-P9652]|uniref:hypothetical protein n=1 Tax=Mycobacterium sp. Marseille-P9652 TaxID=2654950 RepID=UPI0012E950DC|nr:hypothetical protein [Mycobacterium sp. Marseille-P9652]
MSPNSEIEEMIRIAAERKSPDDERRLFSALGRVEMYFARALVEHEGRTVNAFPLLRLPDGSNAMLLCTDKDHPDLPDTFAGGIFEDALGAALEIPGLDWVIVSNRDSQWVSISKKRIPEILDDLRSSTSGSKSEAKLLEDLITLAVSTPPEELSPPIGTVLMDREVFLELSANNSTDGRPIMRTLRIDNLRLIRAYTTRKRPGITYGGIRWEELKKMIETTPELDGVQVVNDADDWVVFDRESLGLTPAGG